ncbi:hypothetical protein AA313_de0202338 [Arthrobotrys entomopaga]|nr:hypothetical protein AA313_de0202338 [Arthrobotrys entomopaga]
MKYFTQIPTMDQAVEFLSAVLSNRRTYLIVDGVDECLQPSEVLDTILGLPTVLDGTTRVLISSRMRPDAFDPDGLYPVIRLTPQSGVYSADLRIFVEDEVSRIDGFHRRSDRFNEAISKIVAASDGNFLWAASLITDLKVANVQGRFWETITTIPNQIKILVKEELWKIWQKPEHKRRLTLEVLEWTIFCMEPLMVGSFPFGRIFDSDGSFLDYEHRRIDRSRFLLRYGTELLMFPTLDGKFELFHHRLADYILLTSIEENPQFQLTDGPTRLALSCVRYLSSPSFQESLNSENLHQSGLRNSQPGGSKNYLRSRYRCIEYTSKHLIHHLLKVSDVTTEDGSDLVSSLITFFLSANAITWVETAQVFDTNFARTFANNSPELLDWVTSVVAVHPRWRDSLPAFRTRLEHLNRIVSSGSLLAAPQNQTRPRSVSYDSPAIQITPYTSEQTTPNEPRRSRSRSPRNLGTLLTSFTGGRTADTSRSPQRRTREEVEQGVERRSPPRSALSMANNEIRRSSTGAVASGLAIVNANASAVPLQYHYPVPCPGWAQQPQPYSQSHPGPQYSNPAFNTPAPQPTYGSPPQQQWYPMQEYYGPVYPQEGFSEPPPPYMRYG